jgi:polyhydroxyalkanoate synthase
MKPVPEQEITRLIPADADRMLHAALGRFTFGLSPAAVKGAFGDWHTHLAMSPSKQGELVQKAVSKWTRLWLWMAAANQPGCAPCIEPLVQDRRFQHPSWQQWPFDAIYQSFLLTQQWWSNATTGVRGVTRHHEQVAEFVTRQMLDTIAPSNFVFTNPQVLEETVRQGGVNLARGWFNMLEDIERYFSHRPPPGAEAYKVGENVAVTPGKVVLRNELIELIQYSPTTKDVYAEPVLIVPAWIMKYYILDLSPHNSLVKYLVDRGHTVFIISWKNPGAEDRDLGMHDYLELGFKAALDAVSAIVPERGIHACGYCLGGTLLSIGAAAMARDGDDRLKSMTLLAAQVDFEEPGELSLFIDESQVTFLEDIMWGRGYLETTQMAGAFQLLRSNDLIWSYRLHNYLLGRRQPMNDLMAWNTDATRMPYRMHTEYLRSLFLNNELAHGRFKVNGQPIALTDIRTPIFTVGTQRDHVAPWRSVYKVHLLTDTEVTFLLTSGGHNAGIVSEPGRDGRSYRIATRAHHAKYLDPDAWEATASLHEGSWWPAWQDWLAARSSERTAAVAAPGTSTGFPALGDAPGNYVMN